MVEQQYVLNKIEQWAERLPYKSLRIEIELPGQTVVLEKEKRRRIGFEVPPAAPPKKAIVSYCKRYNHFFYDLCSLRN